MDVGSTRAWLKKDEFIATADSNIEFIAAGSDQIELIGAGVGESAANGPSAQTRDRYERHAAPCSLVQGTWWQASMIVSVVALTSFGSDPSHPKRIASPGRFTVSQLPKASAPFPQ